jgi:hypothetical protein
MVQNKIRKQNAARPSVASSNWPDKNRPWLLKAESRDQLAVISGQ